MKLLQAVTYFVDRTAACGKAKLYFLLYLLDFTAFASSRRSVTGLDYYASIDGPVPLALDRELDSPDYDFVEQFHINNLVLDNGRRLLALHPRHPFEAAVFTDREYSLLRRLATSHAATSAEAIDEQEFLPTTPWQWTYERASREFELIDYQLAVSPACPMPVQPRADSELFRRC